jgi:phage baseplate assembly protein W
MANPLGVTLPIRLGANGYFEITSDVLTQIKSNLTNLLLTQKGERVMQPDFGSELHRVIFEPMTDDGLANVRAIIETATQQWMPFVQINDVQVVRDEDNYTITVIISFGLTTNAGLFDTITLVF